MSITIALTDAPEFYTNLDVIAGRIVVSLNRPEQVGAIIVKLEGESRTALTVPSDDNRPNQARGRPRPTAAGAYPGAGTIVHENHKLLYKVAQVFPDETTAAMPVPVVLHPGQHEFRFSFKVPFNNACSDPSAMSRIGGLAGAGGYASSSGLFGLGGIRVMDGSKQLLYEHVTKTLPPSFTGFPQQAEIRYFIKVTVQRPGFFKENWRYQLGFKFLPIEPPRPPTANQEAYARRPFSFQPRTPTTEGYMYDGKKKKKKSSMFGSLGQPSPSGGRSMSYSDASGQEAGLPPSIEMSARLPHPSILTCNQPIPLRLIAKKLAPSREQVYLVSLQIELIGTTHIKCQDLVNVETTRWVVASHPSLSMPLPDPLAPVGTETEILKHLWHDCPLPNTVMPSFTTCNLSRSYKLELKLGLSWGLSIPSSGKGKGKSPAQQPETIFLPLVFSSVEVYSGMAPPASLVKAMSTRRPRPTKPRPQSMGGGFPGASSSSFVAPPLPPRTDSELATAAAIVPGSAPPYDEAPPSYDEAMAEEMTGPVFPAGAARPAYSGVTNENAPMTIPEKG